MKKTYFQTSLETHHVAVKKTINVYFSHNFLMSHVIILNNTRE